MTYYRHFGRLLELRPRRTFKRAYRQLAQDFHPDKLAGIPPAVAKLAEEKFKDVQEAYEILTKHRAEYDNQLNAVTPPPPAAASTNDGPGVRSISTSASSKEHHLVQVWRFVF